MVEAHFFCAGEGAMTEAEEQDRAERELVADIVNLEGGEIGTVEAEMVRIHQGGARRVVATDVGLRSGGAGVITAESAGMQLSGAMALRGDLVSMERSAAGVLIADNARLAQSRVGMTITRNAQLDGGSSIFLLAREVNGPVRTVFDTRGSLLAGLTAGIATALVLFVSRLLLRD